jgi:cobalt-zinc-cadmium resistance protein CzcA
LAADKEISQSEYIRKSASDIGKTSVSLQYGQYNGFAKKDNNITIMQTIPFPTAMTAKSKLGTSLVEGSMLKKNLTKAELVFQIKSLYYEWLHLNQQKELLNEKDSIFRFLQTAATRRYAAGDGTLLEKSKAEARASEIHNQVAMLENDKLAIAARLRALLNTDVPELKESKQEEALLSIKIDSSLVMKNPHVLYLKQLANVAEKQKRVEKNSTLPDLTFGYFNQTLYGVPLNSDVNAPLANYRNRFNGFYAGLSIPLWFAPQSAKIKAAGQMQESMELQYQQASENAKAEITAAYAHYLKSQKSLDYYKKTGLPNAELITKQSLSAFKNGEISFTENMINLQQAGEIRQNYLNTLLDYNKSIITLEFLSGINK